MAKKLQRYSVNKHPDSDIDYGRNWGDDSVTGDAGWLATDEYIIQSDWDITCADEDTPTLIEASQGTGISSDGQITAIFLEGGTAGKIYKLKNTISAYNATTGVTRIESKTGLLFCCGG